MKIRKNKRDKGITLIALIITIIVLLILAGVSISLVVGDNGVLTQSQNASIKTAKASFLEEVNMAYADAYAAKMEAGDFSSEMTMADVYNKMSAETKAHVYVVGANTISLVNSSQASVTLLDRATVIGVEGVANSEDVEINVTANGNVYYGEVKGIYYPMTIGTSAIELDENNVSATQPTGSARLGSGLAVTFIDSGETEESDDSNYVTSSISGTIITLTAKAVGSTTVVVRNGTVKLSNDIGVTVNQTYEIKKGTMTNGDITGIGYYASGATATLTATGNSGYVFEKWYDDETENTSVTTGSRDIIVNATTTAVTYTATFKIDSYIGCYVNKGTLENPEYAIIYTDYIADSGQTLTGGLGSVTMPVVANGSEYKTYTKSSSMINPTESKFGANYEITVTGNSTGKDRFLAMKLTDDGGNVKWDVANSNHSFMWFLPSNDQWRRFAAAFDISSSSYKSLYGLSNMYWTSEKYSSDYAYATWFSSGGIVVNEATKISSQTKAVRYSAKF